MTIDKGLEGLRDTWIGVFKGLRIASPEKNGIVGTCISIKLARSILSIYGHLSYIEHGTLHKPVFSFLFCFFDTVTSYNEQPSGKDYTPDEPNYQNLRSELLKKHTAFQARRHTCRSRPILSASTESVLDLVVENSKRPAQTIKHKTHIWNLEQNNPRREVLMAPIEGLIKTT